MRYKLQKTKSKLSAPLLILSICGLVAILVVGSFYGGVISAILLICIALAFYFFEVISSVSRGIILMAIIFLSVFAAIIDLKGNTIYNQPVEKILCKSDEKLEIETVKTYRMNRVGYLAEFDCTTANQEPKSLSYFAIFAIRLLEYFLICGFILFICKIYKKLKNDNYDTSN